MKTYQDTYPSDPALRASDQVRPSAASLLNLEFFEAEPDEMPPAIYSQHHILINLKTKPHRVEHWRDGHYRDFLMDPNAIIVTPAGIESGWRWHETSRVIIITLDPESVANFAHREVGILLSEAQLQDRFHFIDADITLAATLILDALKQGGSGSDVMFESLSRVFLIKLIQSYGDTDTKEAAFSRAYTADHHRRVLDLLSDKFGASIGVPDMARAAGLSESHFARMFKSVLKQTPHQFLTDYRIERAQDLLSDPRLALSEIAISCGFSDQPHLTRLFKKRCGQTPRQWRQART